MGQLRDNSGGGALHRSGRFDEPEQVDRQRMPALSVSGTACRESSWPLVHGGTQPMVRYWYIVRIVDVHIVLEGNHQGRA